MTPDDLSQLVPAFVGAALVILVVAIGILIFVWRQYPPPGKTAGRARTLSVDPERLAVKRGLSMSGVVVLALGVLCLCAALFFGQAAVFGPASLLVELAVAADGIIFLIASQLFRASPTAAQTPERR
jgi:hypothetical protein